MTFSEHHVQRDAKGKFTHKEGTRPTVHLTNGRTMEVSPGELTPATMEAYQEGQCLALAVQVAEDLGGEVCIAYRDDGELSHAWAYFDDGGTEWCIDSYGWMEWNAYTADRGYEEDREYDFLDAAEATALAESGRWAQLPEQDFEAARTFVEPVKALR